MEARESSTETARTDAVYGVSWVDGVLCSTWMSTIVTRGGGGGAMGRSWMGGVMCTLRVKHVYCGTRDAYACGDDARADARLMRARSRRHTRARRETRRAWTRAIDASSREEKKFSRRARE